jgi:hypothetical protein
MKTLNGTNDIYLDALPTSASNSTSVTLSDQCSNTVGQSSSFDQKIRIHLLLIVVILRIFNRH